MAQPIKEDKNITKKSYKTKKQPKKVIDERIPPKKNVPIKGAWKKNRKHQENTCSDDICSVGLCNVI